VEERRRSDAGHSPRYGRHVFGKVDSIQHNDALEIFIVGCILTEELAVAFVFRSTAQDEIFAKTVVPEQLKVSCMEI
jgi:hypothetical protein